MNYINHYSVLIERARNRILDIYTESHHIIPECMSGTDDEYNLVELTPEEHYVAHQLLVKIYPDNYKLVNAAVMMSLNTNGNRPKNKLYGWLRRRLSNVNSIRQSGHGNSQFGTCWIYNPEKQISKKIKKEELLTYISDGWYKGGVRDFRKIFRCIICDSYPNVGNIGQRTCSTKCRGKMQGVQRHMIGPMFGRENEFLALYNSNKNIDKSLKIMGFIGNQSAYGKWAKKVIADIVQ